MLGPPARFWRILISRLIFFFFTGFKTFMMHLSSFTIWMPSKTCDCKGIANTKRIKKDVPQSTFLDQLSERSHSDPALPTELANCLKFTRLVENKFQARRLRLAILVPRRASLSIDVCIYPRNGRHSCTSHKARDEGRRASACVGGGHLAIVVRVPKGNRFELRSSSRFPVSQFQVHFFLGKPLLHSNRVIH